LALRDVEYVIKAEIDLRPHATDPPAKYRAQFRRRVERGQCFNQPYLGCREFAASFSEPSGREVPIKTSSDIGLILHDLVYEADGTGEPRFFEARLDGGVLRVPAFEGVR
jgi:CRISPR-associated protein Cas5d